MVKLKNGAREEVMALDMTGGVLPRREEVYCGVM